MMPAHRRSASIRFADAAPFAWRELPYPADTTPPLARMRDKQEREQKREHGFPRRKNMRGLSRNGPARASTRPVGNVSSASFCRAGWTEIARLHGSALPFFSEKKDAASAWAVGVAWFLRRPSTYAGGWSALIR